MALYIFFLIWLTIFINWWWPVYKWRKKGVKVQQSVYVIGWLLFVPLICAVLASI